MTWARSSPSSISGANWLCCKNCDKRGDCKVGQAPFPYGPRQKLVCCQCPSGHVLNTGKNGCVPTGSPTPSSPPSKALTPSPTDKPTTPPTYQPTPSPIEKPSSPPTDVPSSPPTNQPTPSPIEKPLSPPTNQPTPSPTDVPSSPPSNQPTPSPTDVPSSPPTYQPTPSPTDVPSSPPTDVPSSPPTYQPTPSPTDGPLSPPTNQPTPSPTIKPTPEASWSYVYYCKSGYTTVESTELKQRVGSNENYLKAGFKMCCQDRQFGTSCATSDQFLIKFPNVDNCCHCFYPEIWYPNYFVTPGYCQ